MEICQYACPHESAPAVLLVHAFCSDRLTLQLCVYACSGWGNAPSEACPLLQGIGSAHQGCSQSPAPQQAPAPQPAAASTPDAAQELSAPAGSSKAAAAAPDSCDAGSLLEQLRMDQKQTGLELSVLPASCCDEVLAGPGPSSLLASTIDAADPSGLAPAEQQEQSASAAGSSGPQPPSEAAVGAGPSCESSAMDASFQEQAPE